MSSTWGAHPAPLATGSLCWTWTILQSPLEHELQIQNLNTLPWGKAGSRGLASLPVTEQRAYTWDQIGTGSFAAMTKPGSPKAVAPKVRGIWVQLLCIESEAMKLCEMWWSFIMQELKQRFCSAKKHRTSEVWVVSYAKPNILQKYQILTLLGLAFWFFWCKSFRWLTSFLPVTKGCPKSPEEHRRNE